MIIESTVTTVSLPTSYFHTIRDMDYKILKQNVYISCKRDLQLKSEDTIWLIYKGTEEQSSQTCQKINNKGVLCKSQSNMLNQEQEEMHHLSLNSSPTRVFLRHSSKSTNTKENTRFSPCHCNVCSSCIPRSQSPVSAKARYLQLFNYYVNSIRHKLRIISSK